MTQRIEHSAIVMPEGWELLPDGSAVKLVRDASGTVVARLTTQEVFMPAVIMPIPRRSASKHSA
jgi:hypothetical protein